MSFFSVSTIYGNANYSSSLNYLSIFYSCGSDSVNCGPYNLTLYSGEYIFETWGAEGGSASISQGLGGLGGYSQIRMSFLTPVSFLVYIGGMGESSSSVTSKGGFNGGGDGQIGSLLLKHGGGGGSTDFRMDSNLDSRFIIAGGGGGGGYESGCSQPGKGGHGGGIIGQQGSHCTNSNFGGYGGSQSTGGNDGNHPNAYSTPGTLWKGGKGYGASSSGGGGGGGLYGGGGGYCAGAGGGSGYAGINGTTLDGSQTFPSPYGTSIETGHTGNGAARITRIMTCYSIDYCQTYHSSYSNFPILYSMFIFIFALSPSTFIHPVFHTQLISDK